MTQIPRPQWLSGVPVVPEGAPGPTDAPAARADGRKVSPLPDDLHNALFLTIYQAGVPVEFAAAAAEQVGGNPRLLDALVAYRQQQTATRYVVRSVDDDENDQWTLDAAKAEQASLRHEFPETDWRIYVLTDITEGNTE